MKPVAPKLAQVSAAVTDAPLLGIRSSERVGNTPLLRLERIAADFPNIQLLGKAEWLNPGGSVKDRAASNIVAQARAAGKLTPGKTLLDSTSGKVLQTLDIAEGVDQIAYDSEKGRVYCASRQGLISVVENKPGGAISLGDVKTAAGAKTIAVDPKTHAVWVAYADKEHSYVLRLRASE